MRIRLAENFRAVFYAPFYATNALGFYARQGFDVELVSSSGPGEGVAGLAPTRPRRYTLGSLVYGANRRRSPPDIREPHFGYSSSGTMSWLISTVPSTTTTTRGFTPSSSRRARLSKTNGGVAPWWPRL